MKLLCVVSSLDLTHPLSATPAWWQLLKGLYEQGVDVLATTYDGQAIESLWWHALPNPVKREGDLLSAVRSLARRDSLTKPANSTKSGETSMDRVMRGVAHRVIGPRWQAFMDRTLKKHPDIDAVLFLTIPLNHVTGLAAHIRDKYGKLVLYYDGDVPASLPSFAGFNTGFKIYQGADLSEYDGFISNSYGGMEALWNMGARRVDVLYYGADPDVFSPLKVVQDFDVFFYGHSREYREAWLDSMIANASLQMPATRFAVRGRNLGAIGRAELLPYLSFSKLREYACRSKINLCVTRQAHASVFASSSSRPFELASLGTCIVCNPYLGLETWFEPGKEIVVIQTH